MPEITHKCKENNCDGEDYYYSIYFDRDAKCWVLEESYYHFLYIIYCPFCGVKLGKKRI